MASSSGLGPAFEWTWTILQWPLAFLLVSTAVGLVYYFAPDAEEDWTWITPGAVISTLLWLIVSLIFKFYVANFAITTQPSGSVTNHPLRSRHRSTAFTRLIDSQANLPFGAS